MPGDPAPRTAGPAPVRDKGLRVLARRLGALAPYAVAYGVFQTVQSTLSDALSPDTFRTLVSVAAGMATGALVGCAAMWTTRAAHTPPTAAAPAEPPDPAPRPAPGASVLALSRRTAAALRQYVHDYQDPDLGRLTGVSHFAEETLAPRHRPTAVGTAYLLKTATALAMSDNILNRAAMADTLWKFQLPDSGWAARTQGRFGRPEFTALVLGALSGAGGGSDRLAAAAAVLDAALASRSDEASPRHTHLTAATLCGLVRVWPTAPSVAALRGALLNGAVRDPAQDGLLCWSDLLTELPGRHRVPSTVHTAKAAVALMRAGREDPAARQATAEALAWLVRVRKLDHASESIRRTAEDGRTETHSANHFTAYWVARALIDGAHLAVPGADGLLEEAVQHVRTYQGDGIWHWSDGASPVWMTYQGISLLRDHALYRVAA